jgi:uncharacterized protein YhaN
MSEQEDSTEHLHEKIHEEAHHAGNDPRSKWIMSVALFTALLSVLAAITGMLSAHHENESLIAQIKASDQWSYYQAKGIKSAIISATAKIMHNTDADSSASQMEKYKSEQIEIKQTAEAFEKETEEHLSRHVMLARGVTMFQIAIAISAISILTRKKFFWYVGICFALVAVFFMIQGII